MRQILCLFYFNLRLNFSFSLILIETFTLFLIKTCRASDPRTRLMRREKYFLLVRELIAKLRGTGTCCWCWLFHTEALQKPVKSGESRLGGNQRSKHILWPGMRASEDAQQWKKRGGPLNCVWRLLLFFFLPRSGVLQGARSLRLSSSDTSSGEHHSPWSSSSELRWDTWVGYTVRG